MSSEVHTSNFVIFNRIKRRNWSQSNRARYIHVCLGVWCVVRYSLLMFMMLVQWLGEMSCLTGGISLCPETVKTQLTDACSGFHIQ